MMDGTTGVGTEMKLSGEATAVRAQIAERRGNCIGALQSYYGKIATSASHRIHFWEATWADGG